MLATHQFRIFVYPLSEDIKIKISEFIVLLLVCVDVKIFLSH